MNSKIETYIIYPKYQVEIVKSNKLKEKIFIIKTFIRTKALNNKYYLVPIKMSFDYTGNNKIHFLKNCFIQFLEFCYKVMIFNISGESYQDILDENQESEKQRISTNQLIKF